MGDVERASETRKASGNGVRSERRLSEQARGKRRARGERTSKSPEKRPARERRGASDLEATRERANERVARGGRLPHANCYNSSSRASNTVRIQNVDARGFYMLIMGAD